MATREFDLKTVLLVVLVIMSTWAEQSSAQAGKPWEEFISNSGSPSALKILFVGHSKLYINNMPKMLAYFAQQKAGGQPLKLYSVFGDSYDLETHWRTGLALKAIRQQGPWDYVVLIEKSDLPMANKQAFDRSLRSFDTEIRKAGARTVLLENYTEPRYYQENHRTMEFFASRYRAKLIPIGTAWNMVRTQHSDIDLLQTDLHHPSSKGTYLMSCVCFAYFLKKNPCELPAELYAVDKNENTVNIFNNPDEARILQEAARDAVKASQ